MANTSTERQLRVADPSHSLSIKYVPTEDLRLNPKNPRQHSEKQIQQIANSIQTFGFSVPIGVDANLTVIYGHGRVLAAR